MAKREQQLAIGAGALLLVWLWSRRADAKPRPGLIAKPKPITPDEPRPELPGPGELADEPLPPVEPTPVPAPKPADLPTVPQVGAWISETPQAGRFYQIKQGDTGSSVAGAALGGVGNKGAYMAAWNLVPWNRELYSTPYDPANNAWPQYTSAEGVVIGKAFLPRHQNAEVRIVNGQAVKRNIKNNKAGTRISGAHSSYGLLWLPSEQNPTPPAFIMGIAEL